MTKRTALISIILAITLASLGCSLLPGAAELVDDGVVQTEMAAYIQQTVLAYSVETEIAKSMMEAQATPTPQPSSTATPTPADTAIPTITNTPEDTYISVTLDTNCRVGPGDEFQRVGYLFTGDTAQVIGWDGTGDYYVIKNPQGGEDCWVWSRFAVIAGPTSSLEVYQEPPTPTPTRYWEHLWTIRFDGQLYTVKLDQSGNNISGTFKLENGKEVRISGTISSNQMVVEGSYKISHAQKGTFKWRMRDNLLQFRGERVNEKDKIDAWCGAWNGKTLPAPCELP